MSKSTYKARTGHERYKLRKKNSNGYAIQRRRKALIGLKTKLSNLEQSNKELETPLDLSKDHEYQRIKKEISNIEKKAY